MWFYILWVVIVLLCFLHHLHSRFCKTSTVEEQSLVAILHLCCHFTVFSPLWQYLILHISDLTYRKMLLQMYSVRYNRSSMSHDFTCIWFYISKDIFTQGTTGHRSHLHQFYTCIPILLLLHSIYSKCLQCLLTHFITTEWSAPSSTVEISSLVQGAS